MGLQELIWRLMKDQDREEYTELLRTCNIPVQEWRRYAFLGHRQGCSRNLIYEDKDRFALTLCCWDPGYQNEIHDHNDSACYFKILHGIMQETHFQDNERKADKEYGVGDVCHMSRRGGTHQMTNLSKTERAVSLHLYIPPFNTYQVFNQSSPHVEHREATFVSRYGFSMDQENNQLGDF